MRRMLAALNLLGAAIVAVAVDVLFPNAFSNAEQYFLGLAIFAVLTIVEILYVTQQLEAQIEAAVKVRQQETVAWEARTELDRKLQEVQRLFHQLDAEARTSVDLFYEYHKKKLSDLERSLRDASVKRQTQIDETMFSVTSWLLGSSYHGEPTDILRAVLATKDLDFFFDVHTKMYFTQMLDLISKKSAAGVQRLIVVDDDRHLEDKRLRRLIAFHNKSDKYDCRVLERVHFDRIVADYRLQHLIVDFGIYGTTYLYKGLTNLEEKIVGIYSKDPAEIAEFTSCFESCWRAAQYEPINDFDKVHQPFTADWVFQTDRAIARQNSKATEGRQRVTAPLDGGQG